MTARFLIFFLKAERVGADLMLYGIEFHIFARVIRIEKNMEDMIINI